VVLERIGLSLKKWHAAPNGLPLNLIVSWDSRPDGHRSRFLRRRRGDSPLSGAAGLAHTGASFQKRNFAAGQTAVMDKLLAQGATRPAAGKHRLVAVEPFLADRTVPRLNPQQHRLPSPAALSDTHGVKYSEGTKLEARGEKMGVRWIGTLPLESGR
jgi:hypothetical protein